MYGSLKAGPFQHQHFSLGPKWFRWVFEKFEFWKFFGFVSSFLVKNLGFKTLEKPVLKPFSSFGKKISL